MKKPVLVESSELGTVGTATKSETFTTKRRCFASERRGVTTSSPPSRVQLARLPLTETAPRLSPPKSRLKRDRACFARATIVTSPSMLCDGAAVS